MGNQYNFYQFETTGRSDFTWIINSGSGYTGYYGPLPYLPINQIPYFFTGTYTTSFLGVGFDFPISPEGGEIYSVESFISGRIFPTLRDSHTISQTFSGFLVPVIRDQENIAISYSGNISGSSKDLFNNSLLISSTVSGAQGDKVLSKTTLSGGFPKIDIDKETTRIIITGGIESGVIDKTKFYQGFSGRLIPVYGDKVENSFAISGISFYAREWRFTMDCLGTGSLQFKPSLFAFAKV